MSGDCERQCSGLSVMYLKTREDLRKRIGEVEVVR